MLTEKDIRDLKCKYVVNMGSGRAFKAHDIWIPIFEIPYKLALDANKEKVHTWTPTRWMAMYYKFVDYMPFIDKGVDLIMATDFIEHLERESGEAFLSEVDRVCNKAAIIFTPCGFLDTEKYQSEHIHSEFDIHRSGWYEEDFTSRGYETEVWEDFHQVGENEYFSAIAAWKVFV
jgi:cyclopropane fatty-acyl-phospholipid synthase-like methyltransferase